MTESVNVEVTEEVVTDVANLTDEQLAQLTETEQEGEATETQDDSTDKTTGTETATETEQEQEPLTLEELQEQMQAINKRLSDKDAYIEKLHKVMDKQKTLEELRKMEKNPDDIFDDDKRRQYEDNLYRERKTQEELKTAQADIPNFLYSQKVSTEITDFEQILPKIKELVQADQRLDENTKLLFSTNPLACIQSDADYQALVAFSNQARLLRENKVLKQKHDEVIKSKKNTLDVLEKKNNKQNTLSTITPSNKTTKPAPSKPVHLMSDAELAAMAAESD